MKNIKEFMRKLLIFGLCLMLGIYFSGCSRHRNITEWAEIYKITLNSYLEEDTALNEDIDFIAIDLATLKFTNDSDKNAVVEWFEMQYVPIKNTDLDGLKEEGLFDGMYIPNGVFLTINDVTEKNKEIIISGMKYRSALGANGFKTIWRINNNGIWEFVETVMTWIF
jgi:hypothetical protein